MSAGRGVAALLSKDGTHPIVRRHYERRGMIRLLSALLERCSTIRVLPAEDDQTIRIEPTMDVLETRGGVPEPARSAQLFLVEIGAIRDLHPNEKSPAAEEEGGDPMLDSDVVRAILIWPFDDAPAAYRALAASGGGEDYIAFVPAALDGHRAVLGCSSVTEHDVAGGRVLIGTRA